MSEFVVCNFVSFLYLFCSVTNSESVQDLGMRIADNFGISVPLPTKLKLFRILAHFHLFTTVPTIWPTLRWIILVCQRFYWAVVRCPESHISSPHEMFSTYGAMQCRHLSVVMTIVRPIIVPLRSFQSFDS